MSQQWPANLPCPLVTGTAATISTAVIRTPFEGGNVRQRRIHKQIPHIYQLSWLFRQRQELALAMVWINRHGFDWFDLQLPSAYAGMENKEHTAHTVRLISDLSTQLVQAKSGFYWELAAQAEWFPGSVFDTALIYVKDWMPLTSPLAQPIGRIFK